MKYAQLVMGLLIGTALGGAGVAATSQSTGGGKMDPEAVKAIVRDVIANEPQLILDSVQKYQMAKRAKDTEEASGALKDPATKDAVFHPKTAAVIGNKDGRKVMVEFFDYNCPVCKMQHKINNALIAKDKDLKIILREFPIFGPSSEFDSHVGLAILIHHPDKYETFLDKMFTLPGHGDEKETLRIIKELGLDVEELKKQGDSDEVKQIMKENQELGEKLHIQGTPTLIVGDEVIPHAMSPEELEAKLK